MVSTASDNLKKTPFELYELELVYDGALYSDVIIKAILNKEVTQEINFNASLGEDRINLSGLLGNNNGHFEWGSAGFEKSAQNIRLHVAKEKRYIVADLQDRTGAWVKNCSKLLDDHIDFVEYLTAESNEDEGIKWYRLGFKNVPPPKRTLVLCFDGTSNHFSNRNTNVVKLMELLRKDDPERQMVYYQTGVGTYAPQGQSTSLGLYVGKKLDEKVAWYLYQHVIDGYKYLVETYRAGDRICIFGFSRGAFTARALAGMVHCVGLLPRHNIEHIPFAYKIYEADRSAESKDPKKDTKDSDPGSGTTSNELGCEGALSTEPENNNAKKINPQDFKQTFCIPVKIHFVGVWDTVASVGSIWPKDLPWIDYNPSIIHFRQALALDERRANFAPSLWNHSQTDIDRQTVREVWFRGTHTNIGGGSPLTKIQEQQSGNGHKDYRRLSNITLRWMVRQCLDKEIESGIVFDLKALERYRNVNVLEQRPPQGQGETWLAYQNRLLSYSDKLDKEDMKLEAFESLGSSIGWNVLEFLPLQRRTQTPTGHSYTHIPNRRQPRSVYRYDPGHPIAVHASVVKRMEPKTSDDETYAPRAILHNFDAQSAPAIEDGPDLSWEPAAFNALSFPQDEGWWEWLQSWWKAPAVRNRITKAVPPVRIMSSSESAEALIRG